MADGTCSMDTDFVKALMGYQLTTAHILYHLPDHPALLQQFIWQEMDLCPCFPVLRQFLAHWQTTLEGKLYRVQVALGKHLAPPAWRGVGQELVLD
jgi:uncharacterized protein Usg